MNAELVMADEESSPTEEGPQKKTDNQVGQAAVPAFYVDTWYLTTWRDHVRIAFGESLLEKSNYRTAVVMEFEEIERLIAHLQRVIAKRREKDASRINTEQD
jgi:hypothetical protein